MATRTSWRSPNLVVGKMAADADDFIIYDSMPSLQ
jgi:hypothetical protein